MVYPVVFEVETPGKLSRLTTFLRLPVAPYPFFSTSLGQWKIEWNFFTGWPMVIPQQIALFFIGIPVAIILFLSWWAILFTGRYPDMFYKFISWYFRWGTRVQGYIFLVTDKYPPFGGPEQV